jgi:hypothetical protein
MVTNKKKLSKLIKKNFNTSKENKHALDIAANEIIEIDLDKMDESLLLRLARLLNLNPNSKEDLQKIRNFITTVKSP